MMLKGCFTALVTPFTDAGVDMEGLEKLVDFQLENGISGILAVGTTGESPTLSWEEHNHVIQHIAAKTQSGSICIAGTGSNNTRETLSATEHAARLGVDAVLLVDPYYNGPSSLEIRREYIEPVARAFPEIEIIPYVIPGRTGTQLLPEDLAILHQDCQNVTTVKEATGDLENMRRTRSCAGAGLCILSGDDGMTFPMMSDPSINAGGVISVASNLVPGAVSQMVSLLNEGKIEKARVLSRKLDPLFGLVTVKTQEQTPLGEVTCRARNPLPIKTMMALFGLPAGGCRPPMGKMTRKGFEQVVAAARQVWTQAPEVFQPLKDFFDVNVTECLNDPLARRDLYYEDYR